MESYGSNRRIAAFNILAAIAFLSAGITNIYVRSESLGLYLFPFVALIVLFPFMPSMVDALRRVDVWDWFAVVFLVITAIAAAIHPNAKSATYLLLYCFSAGFIASQQAFSPSS